MNIDQRSFKWMLSVSAARISDNSTDIDFNLCSQLSVVFFFFFLLCSYIDNEAQMRRTDQVTMSAALLCCVLCVLCYLQTERGRTRFPFSLSASYMYKCGHVWHSWHVVHVRSQHQSRSGQRCESLACKKTLPPLRCKHFPSTNTLADTCLALLLRRCALFFWMTLSPLWQPGPSWVWAASRQLHTAASDGVFYSRLRRRSLSHCRGRVQNLWDLYARKEGERAGSCEHTRTNNKGAGRCRKRCSPY